MKNKVLSLLSIFSILFSFGVWNPLQTNAASCSAGWTLMTVTTPDLGVFLEGDGNGNFNLAYPLNNIAHFMGYGGKTICIKTGASLGNTWGYIYKYFASGWMSRTTGITAPMSPVSVYIPNYTPTISSLTVPSYINQSNVSSTPFTINGITDTDAGQTLTYKYSWDNSTWNTAGTGSTPKNNASFNFNLDTSGRPEGNNILYVKVNDGSVDSNTITSVNILKDTIVPTLTQVTPVTNPTNDATPNYTFSSTEAGAISYSGSCSSTYTIGYQGNNTITFNALVDGTYSDCRVRFTDVAGNVGDFLSVTSFTIDTVPPGIPTSVTINSGAQFTNNPTVSLDIVHPNESDVNNWCVTEGNDYGTCSWGSTKPSTYQIQN